MKKTLKSMLHILLAILIVLGSCGIVFAAEELAKLEIYEVDASNDVEPGVYKLVFNAILPPENPNAAVTSLVFSYDTDVIQPVRHTNGADVALYEGASNSLFNRVFKAYANEDEFVELSFAPFASVASGNRLAIKVDTYALGTYVDASNGMVFTEFFYKIKEGAKPNADTFKLETEYYDGSVLKQMYPDASEAAAVLVGTYQYGKASGSDTMYLDSFTFTGSDVKGDAPAEPDVPDEPPVDEPTEEPTEEPSVETDVPSKEPPVEPTVEPTVAPTVEPTSEPTEEPKPSEDAPEYIGTGSLNIYETSVDEAAGVNKLVFKAKLPDGAEGINVTGLVFSYDESVVQPVNKSTYSDVAISPTTTDSVTRRAFNAYTSDEYEFAFAPFNVIRQNGRVAIKVDTYLTDGTADFCDETMFTEFYFRIKDGIVPNYETFKLETEYSDGTILKAMYSDETEAATVILGNNYKYGMPLGNDTLELESFIFAGCDNYEEIIPPATAAPTEEPPVVEPDVPTDEPAEPDVPSEEPPVVEPEESIEPAIIDVTAEMVDPDEGIKKLVFKATTPEGAKGIAATGIVFSYDTSVIQPVRHSNGADITITTASNDTTLKRVFKAYEDDEYAFSFAPFMVMEADGRIAIKADSFCVDTAIDAKDGMIFTEFYYRVKEGQQVTEDTFRLEADYIDGSFLKEAYSDPNTAAAVIVGDYKYGWAKEGVTDTAWLNSFPTEDAEPVWYDISEFTDALEYQYVDYNREEQYYELPELPEIPDASLTVDVTYVDVDGNEITAPKNAGVYDVIISFNSENPNYYTPDDITTCFIIEKIDAVIAADAVQEFVYDGTEKTVAASIAEGDEGVELVIETATEIGEYDVAVIYPESANYYETYKYVRLNILKPTVPIAFVSDIPAVTVDYGTTYNVSTSKLADSVKVQLENGESAMVNIIWRENSTPIYDEITPGTYTFTGEFDLDPEGLIVNPYGLVATAKIVVAEPTIIKNMYVSSDIGIIDETVDVVISTEGNPEMASGSFVIEYDPELLTPERYSNYGVLPGLMVNLDYDYGKIKVTFAGTSEAAKGGDVLKLSFYVSSWNTDKQNTEIAIKDASIYNAQEKRIKIITNNGTITARKLILGDVNDDGSVNILDAYRVLVYDAGLLDADFSKVQNKAADVNKDGCIDIFDAMRIQRYVTGFIGTLE